MWGRGQRESHAPLGPSPPTFPAPVSLNAWSSRVPRGGRGGGEREGGAEGGEEGKGGGEEEGVGGEREITNHSDLPSESYLYSNIAI